MPANTNTDLQNGVNGDVGCKYPCDCATTANINLEGLQTIDGIVGVDGQTIVLVKDQTDQSQNGVYVQSTGEWQRGVWFDSQLNVAPGTLVVVNGGSTNARTIWETVCADNPIEFDTSNITFELKVKGSNTGDITLSGQNYLSLLNQVLTANKIALENMADLVANSFIGNNIGNPAAPIALTQTQATALLNTFVGDSGSGGIKGLVPAPATGDAAAKKFLSANGAWVITPGSQQATETSLGTAEIATQAKTDAGIDDLTFITPLKLKTNQNYYTIIQEQQPSGTGAGVSTSNPQTRVLNTVVNNTIPSASLASNQITLPAGTYKIEALVPGYACNAHQSYLYNVTDSVNAIIGTSQYNSTGTGEQGQSLINGLITISGTKIFELRQAIGVGLSLGQQANMGLNEVYSSITIQKIG